MHTLLAVWAFCTSDLNTNRQPYVTSIKPSRSPLGHLVKVPFRPQSLERKSLPSAILTGYLEPYSNDPTQWLFHGHPAQSRDRNLQLHIALAQIAEVIAWPAVRNASPSMRLSAEAPVLA